MNRAVLHWTSLKGVSGEFISLAQSVHSNSRRPVRAYVYVSPEFTPAGGVPQRCPLSPFLSKFVFAIIMEIAQSICENSGNDIWIGSKSNLIPAGEQRGKVSRFSYLSSCISLIQTAEWYQLIRGISGVGITYTQQQ